jgi:enoyl-CoA hydratase/carnithine racemase
MMSYHYINCERQDSVGMLSLRDRGGGPTAWVGTAKELSDFREEIAGNGDVKVIILKGHENRGFDIELYADPTEAHAGFCSVTREIAELEKPVIASIGGHALGWGLELALSSDLRIASERSLFGLPQITSGRIPWEGGTQRLPRSIGLAKALEMVLTGEPIDAPEAYRIGLVHRIVPTREVIPVTLALAQSMASKGPVALRYAKEAVYKGMDMTLDQGLRLEWDLYPLLQTTADRTEGIEAHRQKKAPFFTGK